MALKKRILLVFLLTLCSCQALPNDAPVFDGPSVCKGSNENLADRTGNVDGWNITERQGVVWAYLEKTQQIEVFWFNYGYLSEPEYYPATEGQNDITVTVPDVELNSSALYDVSATIHPVICGEALYADPDIPPTYEIQAEHPYPETPNPLYPPGKPEGLPEILG